MLVKDKPKVYVISRSFGRYCPEALELVKEVADVEVTPLNRIMYKEDIMQIVENVDGIIGNELFDREVLEHAKRLKIICRHGQVGGENLDLEAATELGIMVTYTPGGYAESVADFTMGLIINVLRNIIPAHLCTQQGKWGTIEHVGRSVHGKTIGIIGLGSVGFRVAKRANSFNMRILIYDPYVNKENVKQVGAEIVTLEELMRESDIVSIHTPLNNETRNLIGKHEIGLMKLNSILISTATGGIIDEEALYEALKEKKLLGAALDVYQKEPPDPTSPLFQLDNIITTPHIASYTYEDMRGMDMMNAEDIVKFFRGEKPIYISNPEVLKKLNLK